MITVFWLDLTWPEPIFITAYLLLHACLQQGEYASLQHQRDVSTHQTKVLLQWHSKHWLGHRVFWTTHTTSACQVSFDFSKQHIQLQPVKWVFWTTHTTSACQVSFLNNTNFSLSSEWMQKSREDKGMQRLRHELICCCSTNFSCHINIQPATTNILTILMLLWFSQGNIIKPDIWKCKV